MVIDTAQTGKFASGVRVEPEISWSTFHTVGCTSLINHAATGRYIDTTNNTHILVMLIGNLARFESMICCYVYVHHV